MTDWPHQTQGVADVASEFERGHKRVCLTSPTGGGKSRMLQRMIERGQPTVVYVNRRMLIDQLSSGLTAAGIKHGIMAAGFAEESGHAVQVASIQTVERRWSKGKINLHPAELVVVDECHNEKGERMRQVMDAHVQSGAKLVGITATPVGLGGLFSTLTQAGTTSELRKCGALVAAETFAPDEPSAKAFKPLTKGMLQLEDGVKEVMLPVVFGRVVEHFHRLNPELKPSLLFAPGVSESLWFAEMLCNHGIPAAHIDGEKIWINGETISSDRDSRERLRIASVSGEVKIVCNRFVMREGVDWPHLAHGIFACTFGGICSYLQAGGRLLRNHPDLDYVTIQDHGGNYWRHDSLNADREWHLDDTETKIAERHAEPFRTKAESEPIVCPQCSKVRKNGVSCPSCGFTYKGRKRVVIQTNGSLREVHGDVYRKRRVDVSPDAHKKWTACVFRCKNSGRTFRQARALFQWENRGMVPGSDFPLLPRSESDWFRKVREVPFARLTSPEGQ